MKYQIPLKLRRHVLLMPSPMARRKALQEHGIPDDEPCWEWQASTNNAGYSQIKNNGKTWNVHRLAYHMLVEKLPLPGTARAKDGDILDHICENRLCINPAHLEKISQSENVKRGSRWRT